jgi:DnaJ homolog subfamily B member 6
MATKLYETLGVSNTATLDESMSLFYRVLTPHILTSVVRKAYKRKALQTHPDRLPQGSTPEDKANSEEQFRLVCAFCVSSAKT